jgi:hypothetical protein
MSLRRTNLREMSDKRRAKLAEVGIFYPTTTLVSSKTPKAVTVRRPKDTDPDAATVAAVIERDRGRCVGCGQYLLHGQRGFDYSVHHRKLRSQGGDNRLSNLVLLCGHGCSGCHGLAHSEVAASRLSGFLMLSTEDPELVLMEHSQHGPVFLLDDGTVAR